MIDDRSNNKILLLFTNKWILIPVVIVVICGRNELHESNKVQQIMHRLVFSLVGDLIHVPIFLCFITRVKTALQSASAFA